MFSPATEGNRAVGQAAEALGAETVDNHASVSGRARAPRLVAAPVPRVSCSALRSVLIRCVSMRTYWADDVGSLGSAGWVQVGQFQV